MQKHCDRCNKCYDDAVDIAICPHDFIDVSTVVYAQQNPLIDCLDELIREELIELMTDDICATIPQWKRYGES